MWISRCDVGDIGHKNKKDILTSQDLSHAAICSCRKTSHISFAELFGHVCLPCEDKSAKLLEEELSQRTNRWDHQCQVCDKAMTRGAEDHFKSKGHWSLGSVCMDLASPKCQLKIL